MAKVDLDLAQVLALFQQMRGVGMAQGMDVGLFSHAAGLKRQAEGPLQRRAAHRFGGRAGAQSTVTLGGKEQDWMAVRFPLLAQEQQRALGQRNITILVALARADMQKHAFGIDVGNLKAQAFTQAQAARVDGDEADAMIQGGNRGQDAARFRGREDDREFELGIGASQFQFVGPDTAEGFFPEQLDGADGLSAGLAGDPLVGLEMDAVLADVFGREQVGGFGVKLTELAQTGVIGFFGAWPDRQQLEVVSEGF